MTELTKQDQETVERIVSREILHCASQLIQELSSHDEYMEDICEFSLKYDYESACWEELVSCKWSVLSGYLDDEGIEHDEEKLEHDYEYRKQMISELDEDISDYSEWCDSQLIECDATEALEFWIVSDWLATKLQEQDELIGEITGFNIWGRTCSGQAISMDYVIENIARKLNN